MILDSTKNPVCQLCGSKSAGTFTVSKDYNWGISGSFVYLKCSGCGLVFQNRKNLEEDLSRLYPQYYGSSANGLTKDFDSKINTRANAMRAEALETFLASGSLLDVGCGSGFFLEYMRRRGWDVSGLDPAKEHVAFAKQKLGLDDVAEGCWPPADSDMQKVDAVSFLHVIEHLNHPVKNLAAVKDILVSGGLLLIETPNIKSWPAQIFKSRWVTLDAPRHLYLYSPDNLRHALEQAEFEILYVATYSPSTMEYSESIRYALADLNLYRRINSSQKIENRVFAESLERKNSVSHFIQDLRQISHRCERIFFNCINALADLMGYGCNVIILARAD